MNSARIGLPALLIALGVTACSPTEAPPEAADGKPAFELLLRGGTVVDGTGAARFRADVGIADGRITAVGDLDDADADAVVDVTGLVVAPGFIDTHNHADWALGDPETAGIIGFLKQGVTTALYGVDGRGTLENIRQYQELGAADGMGINAMSYIGHNGVRSEVMGRDNRAPNDEELAQMKAIVKQAMDEGAVGLSSGLMYLPGNYATTEEVIELAKVTAPYGASYDSHVRDPARNLLASHQECLDIAKGAGVRAHPGHVKAVGGLNFGKGPDFVDLIQSAVDAGQDVTVDLYPYDGAATLPVIVMLYPANDDRGKALKAKAAVVLTGDADEATANELIQEAHAYWRDVRDDADLMAQARENTENPPPGVFSWVQTAGYESMRMVVSEQPGNEGRMMTDLASEKGVSPFEFYVDTAIAEGAKAMVTLGAIQEEDVRIIMKQPWAMISSDGEEINVQHPRGRGTFPRVLGRYVREWGVLTLEEGVHKISGLPAAYLRLDDRGVIREGAVADIAVFDPDTVIDRSTWAEPGLYAEGVLHVLIGGEFALRDGEVTDRRLGRFISFSSD